MLIVELLAGVSYTSECFHCKPGTHSAKPGSPRCTPCPADTYSNKGATVCHECEEDKYAGMPHLHFLASLQSRLSVAAAHMCRAVMCKAGHLVTKWLSLNLNAFSLTSILVFLRHQYPVQGSANQGLHVHTVTTFTPTRPVTLRERYWEKELFKREKQPVKSFFTVLHSLFVTIKILSVDHLTDWVRVTDSCVSDSAHVQVDPT